MNTEKLIAVFVLFAVLFITYYVSIQTTETTWTSETTSFGAQDCSFQNLLACQLRCNRTLTFEFSYSAGFGSEMNNFWVIYLYTIISRRALLISGDGWNYGKYDSIFKPPPFLNCSQIDPRLKRGPDGVLDIQPDHLLVKRPYWSPIINAMSSRYTDIYMNVSYTRIVAEQTWAFTQSTKSEVEQIASTILPYPLENKTYIGVHVRQGDKRRITQPLNATKYIKAVEKILVQHINKSIHEEEMESLTN